VELNLHSPYALTAHTVRVLPFIRSFLFPSVSLFFSFYSSYFLFTLYFSPSFSSFIHYPLVTSLYSTVVPFKGPNVLTPCDCHLQTFLSRIFRYTPAHSNPPKLMLGISTQQSTAILPTQQL